MGAASASTCFAERIAPAQATCRSSRNATAIDRVIALACLAHEVGEHRQTPRQLRFSGPERDAYVVLETSAVASLTRIHVEEFPRDDDDVARESAPEQLHAI